MSEKGERMKNISWNFFIEFKLALLKLHSHPSGISSLTSVSTPIIKILRRRNYSYKKRRFKWQTNKRFRKKKSIKGVHEITPANISLFRQVLSPSEKRGLFFMGMGEFCPASSIFWNPLRCNVPGEGLLSIQLLL